MPDYGCPAGEIERNLEASYAIFPALDHGSTLLARGLPAHPPSGGRKLNGGIMMRPGYKGPTVNIRPPKWTDSSFWIRADNYEDAQYIADAVYYHIGREPFHFCDANFQYPPLRLDTRTLLTREMCSAYVESIAKGPARQKQREDYRERVKELVLKAVKGPEAVLFLRSLRPVARSVTNFEATEEENEIADDGNETAGIEDESHSAELAAEEATGYVDDDESTEQATPMEEDNLSEQAVQSVQSLVPLSSDVPETVDPTRGLAYIASFGFDWFDSENILQSDWQSLGAGCSRFGGKAEEYKVSSNMEGLLSTLDKDEDEGLRSTESSDWMLWRPQPNTSHCTLRYYRRALPSPDPHCEAL